MTETEALRKEIEQTNVLLAEIADLLRRLMHRPDYAEIAKNARPN